MNKLSKVWLWAALILCACTAALNALSGRWLSVVIAVVSIAGMVLLLARERKLGFWVMCVCAVLSCIVGSVQSIQGGTGVLISVGMSLIGSALVPTVTALVLHSQWERLK